MVSRTSPRNFVPIDVETGGRAQLHRFTNVQRPVIARQPNRAAPEIQATTSQDQRAENARKLMGSDNRPKEKNGETVLSDADMPSLSDSVASACGKFNQLCQSETLTEGDMRQDASEILQECYKSKIMRPEDGGYGDEAIAKDHKLLLGLSQAPDITRDEIPQRSHVKQFMDLFSGGTPAQVDKHRQEQLGLVLNILDDIHDKYLGENPKRKKDL